MTDREAIDHAEYLASAYPDCRVTVRRGLRLLLAIEVEDMGVANPLVKA